MANKQSFLKLSKVPITPQISIKIPTVGEVLDDEQTYYSLTSSLTAAPFSYMVQLDDMGIDYTTINEWELFMLIFRGYAHQQKQLLLRIIQDTKKDVSRLSKQELVDWIMGLPELQENYRRMGFSMVFEYMELSGFDVCEDKETGETCLHNSLTDATIDRLVYMDIANTIRKINLFEHVKSKPGNDAAKKYLLEKERRKLKRNVKKPYKPYLENLVIAVVNNREFPYNYEECENLSLYKFNQSFRQIQHKIAFDNTSLGIYTGNINASKMQNKDVLSFVQTK